MEDDEHSVTVMLGEGFSWSPPASSRDPSGVPIVLVGAKSDWRGERQVSRDMATR